MSLYFGTQDRFNPATPNIGLASQPRKFGVREPRPGGVEPISDDEMEGIVNQLRGQSTPKPPAPPSAPPRDARNPGPQFNPRGTGDVTDQYLEFQGGPVAANPQASRVGMYAQQAGGNVGVQGPGRPDYQGQLAEAMGSLSSYLDDPETARSWANYQGTGGRFGRNVFSDPGYIAAQQRVEMLRGLAGQQMAADAEMARVGVNQRELDLREGQAEFERGLLTDPNALAVSFARENQMPPTAIPGLVSQFEKMFGRGSGVPAAPSQASVLTAAEQESLAGGLPAEAQQLLAPGAGASIPAIAESLSRLNVPGLHDPNSDVGRLLLSEIQARYGGDDEALADALMPPAAQGNWFERNVAGTWAPAFNLWGMAPWSSDELGSLWHQGQEGENRQKAVDLYNLYQQQLGGRQLGWQGSDFRLLGQ